MSNKKYETTEVVFLGGIKRGANEEDIAPIATQSEVNTGTDDTKAITPLTLSGRTATTSRTGLVSQSTAEADISTADAIDEATAIALVNELKAKINSMLQSERDAGQRSS